MIRAPRLLALLAAGHVSLANEASLYDQEHAGQALDNDGAASACLLNEVQLDERGWALIPYGDWPHEMGMQKFHKPEAIRMANSFNDTAGRMRRAICGLPIFKGHPDHPVAAIANQYPDKEDKGQIAAVEARDNGLALKLVLSNAGAELVRKGWKFISPMWIGQLISKVSDSYGVYAPVILQSVGLVAKPNIPSPALANAATAANPKTTMDPEMLKLLGLAVDATPAQISAAIKTLHTNAGTLANEQTAHTTAKTALATAEGKIVTLENAATQAKTALTEAQTALANERTARINDALDLAVRTGRCTIAERPTWEGRLKTNFIEEVKVLANAAPKVKTESEIPEMLKTLQKQMEKQIKDDATALANGKKTKTDDEDDDDDAKDETGFGNDDYQAMDHGKRGKLMQNCIANEMKKLDSTPSTKKHDAAFANAKKANPILFNFKQSGIAGA